MEEIFILHFKFSDGKPVGITIILIEEHRVGEYNTVSYGIWTPNEKKKAKTFAKKIANINNLKYYDYDDNFDQADFYK